MTILFRFVVLFGLFAAMSASARDLHVAPLGAPLADAPNGTIERPYPSLADAFQMTVVQGGDRILMHEGSHGEIVLRGLDFDSTVTFQAMSGQRAQVEYILVDDSTNVTFRDLVVSPATPTGQRALVLAKDDTSDVRFENLLILSRPDAAETYLTWSLSDWTGPWRASGVRMEGLRNSLLNSVMFGVAAAITTLGPESLVQGNQVYGYSADGMRGLGDNSVFADNTVINCINVDGNHDDGFQGWAPRGRDTAGRTALSGLQLLRNRIIEWTGPADHPLRCRLQGIGLFAGPYRDLIVQNNLVAVTSYHGITVFGGENARIIGNTVVLIGAARSDGYPWIMIGNRKDGTPARDVTVRNNVAMRFSNRTNAVVEPLRQSNATVVNLVEAFADPLAGDYRPLFGGPLVDSARPQPQWVLDLHGKERPQGLTSDLGAIELD